jgi:DnaJ-class molecular chaperone
MWRSALSHLEQDLSSQDSSSRTFDFYQRRRSSASTTAFAAAGVEEDEEEEGDEEAVEGEQSRQRNKVKLLLHEAISLTFSLCAMVSLHEKQFHEKQLRQQRQRQQRDEKERTQTQGSRVVFCDFCKQEGIFLDKKLKVTTPSAPSEVNGNGNGSGKVKMMRCGKCKGAFYCSKEHQQQHWSMHKVLSLSPPLLFPQ